ncbi:hypothetical protein [Kocuria turfanensis]|uniref:Uncharacterized protein n=1 Tax=Kocuria turfanensis TaxID=388357 RepID=A0A512I890_9MICC|nr:hypothetical protein [Kocuria turfanensis]GEO93906.1 hypothetical protein KTU01_00290 [Kocuria turfanensis]
MTTSAPPTSGHRPRRRSATVLRTGLGTLLGLTAAALVAVLVPLHWAQDTLVSKDGFTQVVGTLAEDEPFQEELARTAVDRAAERIVGERATGVGFLDRMLENAVRRAADVAAGLTSDPAYQRAWTEALARTHEANVPADGSADAPPKHLVLDIGPVLREVDAAVQRAVGVDVGLAERESTITVPGSNTGRLIAAGTRLTDLAVPLTWAAAVLAVLALLVTRHRLATLAVLGLGSLAGLGVVWLVVEEAVQRASGVLGSDPVVRLAADRVLTLLTGSLGEQMATAAWAAGITGVVGLVGAIAVSGGSRRGVRPTA